jgi:hypothetical protein
VDATASARRRRSQGGFPVSDMPARRRTALVADGEVVWFWHPLLVSSSRRQVRPDRARTSLQSASDGGKRNSSPGRARRKPLKPLCRESRMIPVNLWLLTRVLFVAHAVAGASDTRLSLRPLSSEGHIFAKPRTHCAARMYVHAWLQDRCSASTSEFVADRTVISPGLIDRTDRQD